MRGLIRPAGPRASGVQMADVELSRGQVRPSPAADALAC